MVISTSNLLDRIQVEKILAHGANQTVAGHNISVERFEKIAKPQENGQSTVPR